MSTEKTDAAMLMGLAFEMAAAERGISNAEEGERALKAVIDRGREYLSGTRPMPEQPPSNTMAGEFAKMRAEEAEANARNYAGRVRQVLEEIRVAITDGDEQEALDLIAGALGEETTDADE